jgi:hypothetical protein
MKLYSDLAVSAGSLRYPLRSSDEGDGALGVPGMSAQGGGDVARAVETEHPDHEIAQSSHYLRCRADTDLAAVFVESALGGQCKRFSMPQCPRTNCSS